jgi:UDP-N-acetyl-D-mannosaminuronic acid transferase (WecB/TagA/CpsF family)
MKSFKVYSFESFVSNFKDLPNGAIFSFLNPYSCLKINHIEEDLIFGIDSYYLASYIVKFKSISFDNSSFAPIFFEFCLKNNKKVLFIGANEVECSLFITNINKSYCNINADGIDGYREFVAYQEKISSNNYDFVVIGMGSPLQENLAVFLFNLFPEIKFFTCGGYIRQASSGLEYFPPFFVKFRIRFLYRFLKEPHVLKRTFNSYFKFYIYYFYGKFTFRKVQ